MEIKKEYIGVCLFAFVIPLPLALKASVIAMWIMVLGLIITLFQKKIEFSKWVILCITFFLIDIFRSLLFEDFTVKFSRAKMSFLLLPLLFSLNEQKLVYKKRQIFRAFIIGVTTYVLFAIGYLFYFYIKYAKWYTFSFTDHYVIYVLYNYLPGAYHHTYIGLYLAFASILLVDELRHLEQRIWKVICLVLLLIFFVMQFYLGSKMTMLLNVFGIIFYILLLRINLKKLLVFLLGFISSALVLFYIIKDWILISIKNSVNYRIVYLEESLNLIEENFFIGIGLRNIKVLKVCIDGLETNLITHNLFLHELLANGIFGLAMLLLIFFYLFKKALKNKDELFLTFLVITFLLGFTEDFLYLQRGVLFFILFSSIFLMKDKINLSKNETKN